jgi:YbbR domain-containing protein
VIRTWLVDHWRLKALALGLALVLLGTVAFSQNPIRVVTLPAKISSYQITDPDLVLLTYPKTVAVTVVGLQDAVNAMGPDAVTATMDLTKVTHPTGAPKTVAVNIYPKIAAQGVSLEQDQPISVFVTVDSLDSRTVSIEPRVQAASGWTVNKTALTDPTTGQPVQFVQVTGPASEVDTLKAFVAYGEAIDVSTTDVTNLPVRFEDQAGREVRWPPPTIPLGTVDTRIVNLEVDAHLIYQEKQVPVFVTITGQPACGYEPSQVTYAPSRQVVLTGPPDALAGLNNLAVSVDVTGATGNVKSQQTLQAPPGVISVAPSSVTVTIDMTQAFSCTVPPPTPTPAPTPSPTPSP